MFEILFFEGCNVSCEIRYKKKNGIQSMQRIDGSDL